MLLTLFIVFLAVFWLVFVLTAFCPLRAARKRAAEAALRAIEAGD